MSEVISQNGARKLTLAGAVAASLAASACCLGPLLLALLGAGGAGAFATLASFRPYVLVATAAPGRLEAYVAAIDALGYTASLPASGRGSGAR